MPDTAAEISRQGRLPSARDPDRTRAAILQAATREFAENGLAGARVNAIALRSGANKRMLYHYFGDKDALYLAVLQAAYADIRSAETALRLGVLAPEAAICELARFTWQYYLDHPEFLSLLHSENLHQARFLKADPRIVDLHLPLVGQIGDVLRRGATNGVFRADADAVAVYISIASLGFFYLSNRWTLSTIFGRDLAEPEALGLWGAHIEQVVMGYLRP